VTEDLFSEQFSFDVPIGPEDGNRAFFGTNVLQGLIDGIDDFVHERQPRWERRSHRVGAPVLLGCSPWVTDDALLQAIEKLPGACIVVSKWPKKQRETEAFARLRALNETTNGIELRALSGLGHKAPKIAAKPMVMGPYDTIDPDLRIPTFRSIGYRKIKANVPIAHAKLALLGNICWTDEDPIGGVTAYIWFSPKRLWVSSANFTYSSRRSLEHGYWTEDADLMKGVQHFIVSLIGLSEDLDAPADTPDPDLATVEFDDQAMAEAAAESAHARRETAEIEAERNGEEFEDEDW
jgi:hypothetical protein